MRPGQQRVRLTPAQDSLLMRLYNGFVASSSERVREVLAQGLWRKAHLEQMLAIAQHMKESADAGASELAPASAEPGDRAEAVRGA